MSLLKDSHLSYKDQVRQSIMIRAQMDEGFVPEPSIPSLTAFDESEKSPLAGLKGFGVRKKRLVTQEVLVAKHVDSSSLRLRDKNLESWREMFLSLIEPVESEFFGSTFFISELLVVELKNIKTGKVHYLAPPESDVRGRKFRRNQTYIVFLRRNLISGHEKYEFHPRKPVEPSKEKIRSVLERVADSI